MRVSDLIRSAAHFATGAAWSRADMRWPARRGATAGATAHYPACTCMLSSGSCQPERHAPERRWSQPPTREPQQVRRRRGRFASVCPYVVLGAAIGSNEPIARERAWFETVSKDPITGPVLAAVHTTDYSDALRLQDPEWVPRQQGPPTTDDRPDEWSRGSLVMVGLWRVCESD